MALSRVPRGPWATAIGEALSVIPQTVMDRLAHVQFVCGVDPVFAGLHGYDDIADGRSYRNTAHCCYPWHLTGPADRRATTVVLPTPAAANPITVVHELGHALHETVGFDHTAVPVTDYARTNHLEAFAEAFVAWRYFYGDRDAFMRDIATRSLLESL